LHELLERVPVSSFGAPDFDSWRSLPDVAAVVDEAMGIFRISATQREHAERLVWSAFTTPVKLPGGGHVDGLARARQMVREMAFVFACPKSEHRVPVYVRGSIDLAFEYDGRTYFVDWKSDSLAVYGRSALEEHVRSHYAQQVELYTLAVVDLLGAATEREYEARFGGILYSFLRAMGPQGIWSARPNWNEVVAWKGDLATRLSSEREP
jgi:ATP-dependent exoDNAse (exonuclease V) beta subunit